MAPQLGKVLAFRLHTLLQHAGMYQHPALEASPNPAPS